MDPEDKLTPAMPPEAGLLEDDTLRDGQAELKTARGEFRLGHLETAAKQLDELTDWLMPRLSCPARITSYASARVLRARIYEQQNHPEERRHALNQALEAFTRILSQLENSPRAFGDYGIALEMLGRHQEAAAWLQMGHDKRLDSSDTPRYLGLAQRALGLPEAAHTLQEAEKRNPEDRVVTVCLAEILEANGDRPGAAEAYWRASVNAVMHREFQEALTLVDRSSRLRPENGKDLGIRAVILLRLGQYAEALRLIDRAVDLLPPDLVVRGFDALPAAWRVRGRILLQMQRWQEALDSFTRSSEGRPADPVALAGAARALMHLGRWREAIERLDRAAQLDKPDAESTADRALTLYNLGKQEDALSAAKRALELDPNSVYALDVYGGLLQRTGNFAEAVSSFRAILALDPSRLESWLKTSEVLRQAGRPEEALQTLDRAIRQFQRPGAPETAQLQATRGQTLAEIGKLAQAAEAFRESYAASADAAALAQWVDALRRLQDYQSALSAIEEFQARGAEVPSDLLVQKAQLFSDLGEFALAYETLRSLPAETPRICLWRGWALQNQGRAFAERALAEYRRASEMEPSNLTFQYRVASALRLIGQTESASTIYNEIVTAMEQRQASPAAYDLWLLGWCHLGQRCWREAIRYFTAVVASQADVSARFDLALAFLCDGRNSLADQQYRDSVEAVKRMGGPAQRGVLAIALQDVSATAELEPQTKEASAGICELLRQALEEAPRAAFAAKAGGAR